MIKADLVLVGGPGMGKTERLLRMMEERLARGVHPSRIAFVSFTRAAVEEARSRACDKFSLRPEELPFFRTLHSLCYRQLGLRSGDVLGPENWRELGELLGERFQLKGSAFAEELRLDTNGPALSDAGGGELVAVTEFARNTRQGLREAWHHHGGDLDWYRLRRFADAYVLYRSDSGLIDFTDMLERYVSEGVEVPVETAIIDEGQDLTPLQWAVVDRAFASSKELVVGGDDDQAVHQWAGSSPTIFQRFLASSPTEVLTVNHRLPRLILNLASSIAARLPRPGGRPPWTVSEDRPGELAWLARPDEANLSRGSWLLLARSSYQLDELEAVAVEQGVLYSRGGKSSADPGTVRTIQAYEALRAGRPVLGDLARLVEIGVFPRSKRSFDVEQSYGPGEFPALRDGGWPIWHDALVGVPLPEREYLLACLRRGENLTKPPRVTLSTIHGAKGREADNVLLTTDLSPRAHRGFELDPGAEHRVFYVGVTRTRSNLYLVAPRTPFPYHLGDDV